MAGAGAGAAVALSFVIAAVSLKGPQKHELKEGIALLRGGVSTSIAGILQYVAKVLSLFLFLILIYTIELNHKTNKISIIRIISLAVHIYFRF